MYSRQIDFANAGFGPRLIMQKSLKIEHNLLIFEKDENPEKPFHICLTFAIQFTLECIVKS